MLIKGITALGGVPMDAKKMMARKSRIGSMEAMISSVTMCP